MNKDDLIKKALKEYCDAQAQYYEELADIDVQFSKGFEERVAEKIIKSKGLSFANPIFKYTVTIAAAIVIIFTGSKVMSSFFTKQDTKDMTIGLKTETAESAKVKTVDEKAATTDKKAQSDTKKAESSDSAKKEDKTKEANNNQEEMQETAEVTSENNLEKEVDVKNYKGFDAYVKNKTLSENDDLIFFIKNKGEDINTDNSFTISDITFPNDQEAFEIVIQKATTRAFVIKNETLKANGIKKGAYSIKKVIGDETISLEFEIK